ncbi:MAG: flagellar biosynthesis protein FlgJ [Candidatus Scalindua sp.]|jgi:flagellar protein FlgJ|nr:flagellar biosynthesis protein FlgJ [Candidatus Scalindua sp.]MBT6564863.1 flagellar biosynthesis protein FlgJ [Candidatus Scalindua sp.]MBT7592978.1 flagellar biosynthesis protein FlgJ [Candidatus Scalindua sp.]
MEVPLNNEFIANFARAENSKNILKNNPKSSYELQKATQNFEAVMLNMMLKAMWKTIPESGLFEKNSSTQIYEGLMHSSLSEEMASNGGGLGIAKVLYQQLSRDQKQK